MGERYYGSALKKSLRMIEMPSLRRSRVRPQKIRSSSQLLIPLIVTLAHQLSSVNAWLVSSCCRPSGLPNTHDLFHIHSYPVVLLQTRLSFSKEDESSSDNKNKNKKHPKLEDDISKRLSISKDRAISALSQQPPENGKSTGGRSTISTNRSNSHKGKNWRSKPSKVVKASRGADATRDTGSSRTASNLLPPPMQSSSSSSFDDETTRSTRKRNNINLQGTTNSSKAAGFQSKEARRSTPTTAVQRPNEGGERSKNPRYGSGKQNHRRVKSKPDGSAAGAPSYSSLLPPPLVDATSPLTRPGNNNNGDDDDLMDDNNYLSSGLSSWEQFLGVGATSASSFSSSNGNYNFPQGRSQDDPPRLSGPSQLFGGDDMVPPDQQRLPSIQDLFPPDLSSSVTSSSAAGSFGAAATPQSSSSSLPSNSYRLDKRLTLEGVLPVSDLFYRSSQSQEGEDEEHDDEELPFSAEQSDAISSDQNMIRIRRNLAKQSLVPPPPLPSPAVSLAAQAAAESKAALDRSRKMVRRGMDMLVGGVPINADPPQRSIQLMYEYPPEDGAAYDWASSISLKSQEFGPLLHADSISKVPEFERGLFCEYFCQSAIKWDICPKDLHQIIKSHLKKSKSTKEMKPDQSEENQDSIASSTEALQTEIQTNVAKIGTTPTNPLVDPIPQTATTYEKDAFGMDARIADVGDKGGDDKGGGDDFRFETKGEFTFEIGVSREELESGEGGSDGGIFQSVFARAFMNVLERPVDAASMDESEDFVVEISQLTLAETDDGYTAVTVEFKVEAGFATSNADAEKRLSRIGSVFTQAVEDGDIALAIAGAAKEEMRWPEAVRNRVVEECLFQDDEGDESSKLLWKPNESPMMYDSGRSVVPERIGDGGMKEELYRGGGNDGVFYDFSAANVMNAPYSGEIGLRLVDAVTERAKQRQPKVIAIGDVHGCIDELQDLLRQCDYRPGDLVVFLGDLVCKGPDSISVVQMAREIGAIGVRGNHDFEVVRWHQAIKTGVDPPVFGSEHFHIASCLSKADMNWMYSLPWYISSKDLGALFVHAGFVSGIRLAKQNPRLMMNMRSILPDGTVTSKFFNNWPWARLWDGPQTVLFGHDADRGLQQYEHAIGLDTGCVYGGRLTACILPEKRLVSVSARREYFKYRRKHYG